MPNEEHHRPPYIDESLIINTRLNEIERRQEEEKAEEKEYKRRQLRFNRWTVIFTGLLFITSGISDWILFRQTKATRESADAAKSAAETADNGLRLSRDALRASSAGIIVPNLGFQQGSGAVNVVFENRGKGNAWNISADYRISVMSLPGDTLIRTSEPKKAVFAVIGPGEGPNNFTVLSPYTRDDFERFTQSVEAIKAEGTYSYDNSFTKLPPQRFCIIAMLGNAIPCADLAMRLRTNSDPFHLNRP